MIGPRRSLSSVPPADQPTRGPPTDVGNSDAVPFTHPFLHRSRGTPLKTTITRKASGTCAGCAGALSSRWAFCDPNGLWFCTKTCRTTALRDVMEELAAALSTKGECDASARKIYILRVAAHLPRRP